MAGSAHPAPGDSSSYPYHYGQPDHHCNCVANFNCDRNRNSDSD